MIVINVISYTGIRADSFLKDYFDLMIEPEQFETLYFFVRIQIITNKLILMSNLFLQLAETIMRTGSIALSDSAAMLLQNEMLKETYPGE